MAGSRDGETAETAFERRELPRGPVTGDPVLVDGRDGRERREECRERGVEMGSAGPVAGEGMAEREEEWRCAGLGGMWRWTGGGSAGGGGDMLGGGEAERALGGFYLLFVLGAIAYYQRIFFRVDARGPCLDCWVT